MPSLTPKQQKTLDELRNKNYDNIKMNEISSALNGAFNKDQSAEIKKEIITGGIKWFLNNPKSKVKDKSAINKILISKIKRLASSDSDKTTKQMRAEERELFQEVKNKIIDEKDEEEKHDDKDDKDDELPLDTSAAPPPAAPVRAPQDEVVRLQAEALARIAEQDEAPAQQVVEDDRSALDYINSGSQFYQDNKKVINKALAALTPKKIEDGSYLTELASLSYPEIQIFQKTIKDMGLGFSNDDKAKFEAIFGTSDKARAKISSDDKLRLIMKGLINPDQYGVLLRKLGENVAEDAKGWWEKVTTGKERLTPDQRDIQEKVDERRKKIDEDKKRKSAIDEWFGDDTDKVVVPTDTNPFKPMAGDGDKIHGGGSAYNPNLPFVPVDDNIISSYDILLPPNWKDYKNTDAGKTIAEIMESVSTFGISDLIKKITGADGVIDFEKFKRVDPEGYSNWKKATDTYNSKINKAGLDREGAIDYDVSKDYVDNASAFTEDLIKKAITSGKIDRTRGEGIYDLWNAFNKVKSGDLEISYKDMEELQQKLINFLPRDVITENSDIINQYMTDNADYINPAFEGDSDLGNFDWLQNILDGKTIEGDIDTDLIKEKTVRPEKQPPMIEPKLRYKGRWGGTDEIFERQNNEIEKRNLVIEVQRLREDLDVTNKLIQAQILTDQRRFDNCFAPPTPEPQQSKALPNKFKRDHRAILQPVVLPNPLRPFEKNTRDEADYQQYKEWTPNVPETTARFQQMKNQLVYPSITDMATGGESLYVAPPKEYNYILNQRFTR